MAYTQADIDGFKAAIAASKGALTIEFGDQKMTFRSADDITKLLGQMERDVATTAGTPRTRFAIIDKGV